MPKPLKTAVEKGWRVELFGPNGWTSIHEHPFPKLRAVSAARNWRKDFKIRARIVRVRVTTETLAQEEV